MSRSVSAFFAKIDRELAEVERLQTPEHTVTGEQDWGKSFRSRPGSADYRGHCTCGWQSSGWHYDEAQARRAALRHLRTVAR